MRRFRFWALATACAGFVAAASPAAAQVKPATAPRFTVTLGASWLGGTSLGSGDANLLRNQTPPGPYPLFKTSSVLRPSAGFDGRLGWRLTRWLGVEGGFSFARPRLETDVSADVENAPRVTALERVSQYVVEGTGVFRLTRWHLGRGVPFVLGGAGYVRQLHDRDVLAESGMQYHAGGGLVFPLRERPPGVFRSLGVRFEARVILRKGGVDLEEQQPWRALGDATAALSLGF